MKRCAICAQLKELEAFPKSRSEKDGRYNYCRPCNSERRKRGKKPKRRVLTADQAEAKRKREREYYVATKEYYLARRNQRRRVHNERYRHEQLPRTAERRARRLQAMPPWANKAEIEKFYREAEIMSRVTGIVHHVDHIVPLVNALVCGLHVPANLRVVTAEFNLRKHNKFRV